MKVVKELIDKYFIPDIFFRELNEKDVQKIANDRK